MYDGDTLTKGLSLFYTSKSNPFRYNYNDIPRICWTLRTDRYDENFKDDTCKIFDDTLTCIDSTFLVPWNWILFHD